MAYRTKYIPKNKEKYIGDVENIVCRSLWERTVCKFCDEHPNILKWASEEIAIPYMDPIENKLRNYVKNQGIKNYKQIHSGQLKLF